MMKKPQNPSAFPVQNHPEFHLQPYDLMGMTLRDYFAGHALIGLLPRNDGVTNMEEIVKEAFKFADAMLVERERTPNENGT